MENDSPVDYTSGDGTTPAEAMDNPLDVDNDDDAAMDEEEEQEQEQTQNPEDLPLAEGTEHQRQVSEDFHKQQEELYRR